MLYDMHVHSTASDGTLSPEEIINKAVSMGLSGIAITDHDTVDGLLAAEKYLHTHEFPLDFIPGIELNTDLGKNEIHILGYYIDYNNRQLNERLVEIRGQRQLRAQKMVDKLCELGMKIEYSDVINIAGSDLIARPHIAMAMIKAGYVDNVKEAFDRFIGKGKPAYVSRYKFMPEEAVKLIASAGGIPVLAHPGLIADQSMLPSIIAMGVAGLEVYYPEHSEEQMEFFLNLAMDKHLLVTGGSDFHGLESNESRSQLGAAGISNALMSKIKVFKKNLIHN